MNYAKILVVGLIVVSAIGINTNDANATIYRCIDTQYLSGGTCSTVDASTAGVDWTVECPAGNSSVLSVSGIGVCTEYSGYSTGDVLEEMTLKYSTAYQITCVCKMLVPAVSKWIVGGNGYGMEEYNCHQNCNQDCATLINSNPTLFFGNNLSQYQ